MKMSDWLKHLCKLGAVFRKDDQTIFDNSRDWLREAKAIQERQDWQLLIMHCQEWVQAEPRYYFSWTYLGMAYQFSSQFDSAIEAYQHALQLNPDDSIAGMGIGMCNMGLNGR